MSNADEPGIETSIAQGLHYIDPVTGGVIPPIQPSTTFARDSQYRLVADAHSYARDDNPVFLPAERMLSRLEGGADALLFSSGMAAAMAVVQTLRPGDHIVAPRVMYWGLRKWLQTFCKQWGIDLDLFDASEPAALQNSVRKGTTRLIWIETPCNPTWDVIDIAAAADVARSIDAKLVVDSTVATPALCRPLELGADLVMHSATKYLNGHGDVVARGAGNGAGRCAVAENSCDTCRGWCHCRQFRGMVAATAHALRCSCACNEPASPRRLLPGISMVTQKSKRCCTLACTAIPAHIAARQMHGGFGGMLSLRIKGGADAALRVARRWQGTYTSHIAWRRGKPDRASSLDRRSRQSDSCGPAQDFGRHRGMWETLLPISSRRWADSQPDIRPHRYPLPGRLWRKIASLRSTCSSRNGPRPPTTRTCREPFEGMAPFGPLYFHQRAPGRGYRCSSVVADTL
ncbi:MAG: PLP-dependent transferase [Woeseiaceae bacterium]|nr:PLP-dependent transferase [Woeseiaceae bacterium]